VVNGHKSAADANSPDGGTGKTCLGGGMHCPSASSYIWNSMRGVNIYRRRPVFLDLPNTTSTQQFAPFAVCEGQLYAAI